MNHTELSEVGLNQGGLVVRLHHEATTIYLQRGGHQTQATASSTLYLPNQHQPHPSMPTREFTFHSLIQYMFGKERVCGQGSERASHLHDEAKRSCVRRGTGGLLGELFLEAVTIALDVVMVHHGAVEHQGLPALATGITNGVDEELEVLLAELGRRVAAKRSDSTAGGARKNQAFWRIS